MDSYNAIKNELLNHISEGDTFTLTQPEDSTHGNYATNIAFIVAKEKNLSPKFCATELSPLLQEKLFALVEKVEVAGPGFINFFLKASKIQEENKKDTVTLTTMYTGKNVLVEHSSPNLFKPFSVGHLMNNVIGEFVACSMKKTKANIHTMSFPSDVSLGIAKALMIIEEDNKQASFFENKNTQEVIAYLGEAYTRGVKKCEESEDNLNKAKVILDKLYRYVDNKDISNDAGFSNIVISSKEINEDYFKHVLASIGSSIEVFVYESEAGNVGSEIVRENTGEGKVFTESEGAVVYIPDEERKDLHTAVFINSQGYPTYEAKDIGLLEIKFGGILSLRGLQAFIPDYSFFITDQEQVSHFKIVLDAASKLGGEWIDRVKKSHHVPHGRMLFKGEKMSSRLGGVPLALDVINVVEEEVRERAGEKTAHLSGEEKKHLEREIALSALRIAVLRSKPGININFDPEASLSFEGDSGPYLLYTHARCSSLLEKGKDIEPHFSEATPVTALERNLSSCEVVFTETIESLSPQKMVTYLFRVAQEFNSFYGSTQIITDDVLVTAHHLAIVKRTKMVLKEGLSILGISAPERM